MNRAWPVDAFFPSNSPTLVTAPMFLGSKSSAAAPGGSCSTVKPPSWSRTASDVLTEALEEFWK